MNEKNTASYSSDTLKQGKSRTDWDRVNAMTDDEAERNALEDADAPPITSEQWEKAVLVVPGDEGKERIALWVDKDVLRYFGKGSKGYQKRLNAALRRVMATEILYGGDNRTA